jgi:hypothetical protein
MKNTLADLLDAIEKSRAALRDIRSRVLDRSFNSGGFDTIATIADDALDSAKESV